MPRRNRFCLTVSPPTFERADFAGVARALCAPGAEFSRDWLLTRFSEGLEIRMLRAPLSGFVVFQPGRLAWRPIEGAEHAIVVEELRVAQGPRARAHAAHLWRAVEGFARFYGYEAVVALTGPGAGMIDPRLAPRRGWSCLDDGPAAARLIGRVLQGPVSLPHLPRDWGARAARTGPGLVIQSSAERADLLRRADDLERLVSERGMRVRRERFATAQDARRRATSLGGLFSVVLDGEVIGGAEVADDEILARCLAEMA